MVPEQKQKFFYIANARLPTEKAHGIQIIAMVAALRQAGVDVELIIPNRKNIITTDIFSYYNQSITVPVRKLWCIDWLNNTSIFKPVAFWIETISFAISVARLVRSLPLDSILYTRDLPCLLFLPRSKKVYYEIHSIPEKTNWLYRWLLKKSYGIVAITQGLKNDLMKLGISETQITVAPDAIDPKLFSRSYNKDEARQQLNLPKDRRLILYTGHLYAWKGADTLLAAAMVAPEYTFVFVGGTPTDVAVWQKKIIDQKNTNCLIVGHCPQSIIPMYLAAADILVIPNSARFAISVKYTSPMKLFEYMAARRPIVASDLPSLREVLDDSLATFFTPDDPNSLIAALHRVMDQTEASQKQADKAYETVMQNYTWEKRVARILSFISNS